MSGHNGSNRIEGVIECSDTIVSEDHLNVTHIGRTRLLSF